MILSMSGGQHGSEHFRLEQEFAPPERVLIQTAPQTISVYKFDKKRTHYSYKYQGQVSPHILDGLVEFINFG